MSSLAEVVKVIRETNDAEARRKEAADKFAIANENKKFDDLTEMLKKTSDENKRAQIEANIALIEETRAARKANEDNRSTAKKNLDENNIEGQPEHYGLDGLFGVLMEWGLENDGKFSIL